MEDKTVETAPPVPGPRLTGLAALTAKTAARNKVPCALDVSKDVKGRQYLSFSVEMDDFINGIEPTKSGNSEGVMLDLSGTFSFDAPDGKTYTLKLAHMMGGGAFVGTKLLNVAETPPPKTAAASK